MGKKSPDKPKRKGKAPPAALAAPDDDSASRRRAALLRDKLVKAMDDPLMRNQIVTAIRSMITDGK